MKKEDKKKLKLIVWLGSSKRDLMVLPQEVITDFGHALRDVQYGCWPSCGKFFRGCGDARVIELREDFRGDTFRAVYTIRFGDVIYVLHVFQKKSKHGIATPKEDLELIRSRLKLAEEDWKKKQREKK